MVKSQSLAAGAATLQAALYRIDRQYKQMHESLEKAIAQGQTDEAKTRLDILLVLAGLKRTISTTSEVLCGGKLKPIYVCSSWFLRQCLIQLTKTANESMLFATGLEIGILRTLDRQLWLEYDKQTPFYVSADSQSNREALRQLDSSGQRLLAWMHSHPGKGPAATFPSQEDQDHQRDLEAAGYPTIGGIFSRDGCVRFFSHALEFEIHVVGSQVTTLNNNLVRLELP